MRLWSQPAASVRRAEVADCDVLADIHSASFKRGWSGAEFESLLVQDGTHPLIAFHRNAFGIRAAAGFSLYRLVEDEAEILSIAVAPQYRRRGIGRLLLEESLRQLYRDGARTVHLEVEDSNLAAIALYRRLEFRESARREGYYAEGRQSPAGALVMVRQLR
jgi:[ribosomal protein S18]-alanine N-acetyltransferase